MRPNHLARQDIRHASMSFVLKRRRVVVRHSVFVCAADIVIFTDVVRCFLNRLPSVFIAPVNDQCARPDGSDGADTGADNE